MLYIFGMLGDCVEMSYFIEGCMFFFDYYLFEWVCCMLDEVKICNGVEKFVLCEVF